MIHVAGSPIGGENPPHDKHWRAAVAAAAAGSEPATAVQLDFRLEPHRTVDLDNLVRPVLAGLRDAGAFARGYRRLDAILATKTATVDRTGVDIQRTTVDEIPAVSRLTATAVVVAHAGMPRDDDRQSKRDWRDTVRRHRDLQAAQA